MINEKELRKAYFSGKLNKYLDELSGEQSLDTDDLIFLNDLLVSFVEEKKLNEKKSALAYGEKEPPSSDELFAVNEQKKEEIKKWLDSAKQEIKKAQDIIQEAGTAVKSKRFITKDEWLAWGFELLTLIGLIDNYTIICEQFYRKRITDLIDGFGMSRAEAEERARLTDEYKEYKRGVAIKENAIEVEMLCKKWAGI